MSSVQQRGGDPQSFRGAARSQRIEAGDVVMIVRSRAGNLLGQVGTVIGRSADLLTGKESQWERDRVLATDWVVDMASGRTAHAREDGLIITSYVAFFESSLMRIDATEQGLAEEAEEEMEGVA